MPIGQNVRPVTPDADLMRRDIGTEEAFEGGVQPPLPERTDPARAVAAEVGLLCRQAERLCGARVNFSPHSTSFKDSRREKAAAVTENQR